MFDVDKLVWVVLVSYFVIKFVYFRLYFWIDEKVYLILCNGKCLKGNIVRELV